MIRDVIMKMNVSLFGIITLIIFLSLPNLAIAGIDSLDGPLNKMARGIGEVIPSTSTTIAVLPFRSQDGSLSLLGVFFADSMTNRLIKNGLTVLDRKNVDKILGEMKLESSGLINDTESVRLGNFLGAKLLAVGTLTSLDSNSLLVNVRLVDAETTKILVSFQERIKRNNEINSLFSKTSMREVGPVNTSDFSFVLGDAPKLPTVNSPLDDATSSINDNRFSKMLGDMDIDALVEYDSLLKYEKTAAEPEDKAKKWDAFKERFPKYSSIGNNRVKEWTGYANTLTNIETIKQKRQTVQYADWRKLKKLLNLSVIDDINKRKFIDTYISAYGRRPFLNPYVVAISQYLPKDYFTEEEWKEIVFYSGMAFIPGGEFVMGSGDWKKSKSYSNQGPPHKVYLDGFFMDMMQVTAEGYAKCKDKRKCSAPRISDWNLSDSNWRKNDREKEAINFVSWQNASDYCAWMGKRLPTEAEWEYAGRSAGKAIKFPWGNMDSTCEMVVSECATPKILPPCSKPAGNTEHDLCDMLGNLAEWVADWYSPNYYEKSLRRNPKGPDTGEDRVVRGEGWDTRFDKGLAYRWGMKPDFRDKSIGFRCVADLSGISQVE